MAISIITHPILSIKIIVLMMISWTRSLLQIGLWKMMTTVTILVMLIVPFWIEHEYSEPLIQIRHILYFGSYWILLGVASSIGLGTGLHTFVLYLGPHIAKTVIMAHQCNHIPIWVPNRFQFQNYQCDPSRNQEGLTIISLISSVQLESMLWGLGTALGELPPYFVARAASVARQQLDELDEIDQIHNKTDKSITDRIKLSIFQHLQKHAFITVLLCASIPNPLFDLAGITCGHFQISFWIFFISTSIGKAIIKTHIQVLDIYFIYIASIIDIIQMVFVIVTFSKHQMDSLISSVETILPISKGQLSVMFEKQKKMLSSPQNPNNADKPIIGMLWDYFITGMIVFFIYQTLNSLIQDYHQKHFQSPNKEPKQKKKKI